MHIDGVIESYAGSDWLECFDKYHIKQIDSIFSVLVYSDRCTEDVEMWREQQSRQSTSSRGVLFCSHHIMAHGKKWNQSVNQKKSIRSSLCFRSAIYTYRSLT